MGKYMMYFGRSKGHVILGKWDMMGHTFEFRKLDVVWDGWPTMRIQKDLEKEGPAV
jgi:hypothetical protein